MRAVASRLRCIETGTGTVIATGTAARRRMPRDTAARTRTRRRPHLTRAHMHMHMIRTPARAADATTTTTTRSRRRPSSARTQRRRARPYKSRHHPTAHARCAQGSGTGVETTSRRAGTSYTRHMTVRIRTTSGTTQTSGRGTRTIMGRLRRGARVGQSCLRRCRITGDRLRNRTKACVSRPCSFVCVILTSVRF